VRLIPEPIFDTMLLKFPTLYKTKLINYESYLGWPNGINDLLAKLDTVLDIEGDVIECGSARCGTSVIIAKYLKEKNSKKKVYALDLFGGGFDPDELRNERQIGLTKVKDDAFTYNSYNYVRRKIEKLGFSDNIITIQGLFQETIPKINSRFCLSLIDCDLKNSIMFAADTLLPHMSNGSVMLFDDYLSDEFKGAKIAVDSFLDKHRNEISEHKLLNQLYYVRINR
jgi:Macrocin-O-methyltransferase (TylF)